MALTKVKGSGLATGAATDNLVGIDDNATSTAITIDASENVGIGIVPIAGQHSAGTSLQLSSQGLIQGFDSNSNEQLWVGCNNYYSSASTNKYIETDAASRLAFDNAGNMTFYVAPSGTAGNAISWTTAMTIANGGNVTVNTGNLVIGTSGKGIDFSADGNAAGMTSEVLDDYEEGTWTPVPKGSTTVGTISIPANHQSGTYTKIGDIVHISMFLYGTNFTGAGTFEIHGLPFAHQGSSGTLPVQINTPPWNTLPADNQNITGYLTNNTIMTFRATNRNKAGAYVTATVTSPSTIGYLRVNGSYKTA
jgi:hypothetical protein